MSDLKTVLGKCYERQGVWTIEALTREALRLGAFGDGFEDRAVYEAASARVRRQIKQMKDPGGYPLIENIARLTEDGDAEPVYKIVAMFNVDEYRSLVAYYRDKAGIYIKRAIHLVKECKRQHGVQLPFDFGLDDIADNRTLTNV